MKLVIDMNLSPRWTEVLTSAGFEAVHWSTIGAADANDREIVAVARERGAVVPTHDLDFGAILATAGARGPSVVQLRSADVRPEQAGAAVIEALRQCQAALEAGALLTVDPARYRVSLLPLQR